MNPDPILTVLLLGGLAAAVAALGAAPFAVGHRPARLWVGCAYALSSGVMIGAGYLLGLEGLERSTPSAAGGALLGIGFTFWTHRFTELPGDPPEPRSSGEAYRLLLQNTLHSASEGLAIGVATAVSLPFGIFMAAALALHNIGEATALTEALRHREVTAGESAGVAVAIKASQPLLAVASLAVLTSAPVLVPGGLGFAAGALLTLVLAELAPAAYRFAGRQLIAVMLASAAAAVLLFEDLLL